MVVQGQTRQEFTRLHLQKTRAKWTEGMAQQQSSCFASVKPSSNPSPTKKKTKQKQCKILAIWKKKKKKVVLLPSLHTKINSSLIKELNVGEFWGFVGIFWQYWGLDSGSHAY
jgi:hypothetical protein